MKVNDTVYYVFNAEDGYGCFRCTVREVLEDHVTLMDSDGVSYWIETALIDKYISDHPVEIQKKKSQIHIELDQ